jgi:hypothetical protein
MGPTPLEFKRPNPIMRVINKLLGRLFGLDKK